MFFTVALEDRPSTLLVDLIDDLRWSVGKTLRDHPVAGLAWTVLPDHLHAIWQMPEGDRAYGQRWGAIKSRFTRSLRELGLNPTLPRSPSKIAKGDAGFWQRRFWENHIRDDAELQAHMRYCWVNPVKHGLVDRPEDWPFSSFAKRAAAA